MPPSTTPRPTPWLHTLPGVLLAVLTYTLIHASTRLIASGNLGEDDPVDSLLVQTLQGGYSVHQGPLYDWLLWAVQHVVGTGLPSFLLIKYALLVATAGFIFLSTRRLTGSSLWAFIAVESMAAVYQIFWRLHEGFTHRVLTMALVMATLWFALRLLDHGRRRDHLIFGGLVACGLLSEHSYLHFLAALLLAIAVDRKLRVAFWATGRVLLWLPGLLLLTPYALWLTDDPARLGALWQALLPPLPATRSLGASLYDAASYPFLVLSPYLLVALLVFPRILRPLPTVDPALAEERRRALCHLLGRTLAIEIGGLLLLGGVIWAHANYAVHLILPMMIIALPWLTARIHDSRPSLAQIRRFMVILLAFTAVAYAMRSGNLFVWEPFCSRCRWGTPYEALAERLRQDGFSGGTVISEDIHTLGNLHRFFPDSRFVLSGRTAGDTAGQPVAGPVLRLTLRRDLEDREPLPDPSGDGASGQLLIIPWQGPLKPAGYRHSIWEVRRVAP